MSWMQNTNKSRAAVIPWPRRAVTKNDDNHMPGDLGTGKGRQREANEQAKRGKKTFIPITHFLHRGVESSQPQLVDYLQLKHCGLSHLWALAYAVPSAGKVSHTTFHTETSPHPSRTNPGLPWWLSGKDSTCRWKRHDFDPWSEKIPHASEQQSLCATILSPRCGACEPKWLSPCAELLKPTCPRACAPQQEKEPPWEACKPLESSPR